MTTRAQSKLREIPEYLIYEMDEGKPIYYRGYEDVLAGRKAPEAIMGESTLQSWLKTQIIVFLSKVLDENRHVSVAGELGLLLSKKTFRAADISIFTKENFHLSNEYAKLPPEIVIEIDTKAHIEEKEHPAMHYFHRKTQQLFDFGVQRVIWIFTADQKVMFAEPNQDWIITDWHKPVLILDAIYLNIKELLNNP